MNKSDRANEARSLADFAQGLLPREERTFEVDEQFHGRESEIIEGAKNMLEKEGGGDIKLAVESVGVISVQA